VTYVWDGKDTICGWPDTTPKILHQDPPTLQSSDDRADPAEATAREPRDVYPHDRSTEPHLA
jgi:hypothetical protein